MRASVFSATLLAAGAHAIKVTSPTKNQDVQLSCDPFTVTWSTVSTDPTTAHLFLVNQAGGHTPYSKDLGSIDLTKGSYSVAAIAGLSPDTTYQFNIQSTTTDNNGILAQSDEFAVVACASSSSSSSMSASASSTAVAVGSSTGSPTVTSSATGSISTAATLAVSVSVTASSSSKGSATSAPSASTSATSTAAAANGANKVVGGSGAALALAAAVALLA